MKTEMNELKKKNSIIAFKKPNNTIDKQYLVEVNVIP